MPSFSRVLTSELQAEAPVGPGDEDTGHLALRALGDGDHLLDVGEQILR